MKCRISVLRLSFLSVFLLLGSVFLSFTLSPETYATSVKCFENNTFYHSYTGSYLYFDTSNISSTTCDVSSLDSSKNWYYYLEITTGDGDPAVNNGMMYAFYTNVGQTSGLDNQGRIISGAPSGQPAPNETTFSGVVSDQYLRTGYHYRILGGVFYWNYVDEVVVSDDVSGLFDCPQCEQCEECQECQECQECPEGGGACNYDEKFDGVITAIYTIGAVALVIYFFYCIYRMIIGTSGSWK